MTRMVSALGVVAFGAMITPHAQAEPLKFPYKNQSDLRGVLNAFHAFKHACLDRATQEDLPTSIRPEGYRIVTFNQHMGFEEGEWKEGTPWKILALSRTGTEEGDWSEGEVIIHLSAPREGREAGGCRVDWHRGWDYAEGVENLALGLYGVMDAQISYRMEAFRNSPPEDAFLPDPDFSGVSEWYTWCWDGRPCTFTARYRFDPKRGVEVTLEREKVRL